MRKHEMKTVVSHDGTAIAFDRSGDGPAVILVGGALQYRAFDPRTAELASMLAPSLTVFNYDRRGRGDSGDTPPYAVERELEDLEALIEDAGGAASLYGSSSGGNLALAAAASGLPVTKLAVWEANFHVDDSRPPLPDDYVSQLEERVAAGRRGDAVELYQRVVIGIPDEVVAQLRQAPFRPGLEAIAHTLAYDVTAMGDYAVPAQMLAQVSIPALVIAGGQSPPPIQAAAAAVADALPNGRCVTLASEGHDISPQATAPVVAEFLCG
jgi:pimeloyl-ACP methyl ester carboxylesterase